MTRRIALSVELREGEAVRVANGGTFVRLDVTGQGYDHAKAQAIRAARQAGVITEAEERHKLVDLGQYVSESWMWSTAEVDRLITNFDDEILSSKAEELLANIRARVDARSR